MFCAQCGTTLKEGALFCSNCGAKAAALVPAQDEPQPVQAPEKQNTNKRKLLVMLAVIAALGITLAVVLARGKPIGGVSNDGASTDVTVFTVDLDRSVTLGTPISFTGGASLPHELQWLAVQTACIGIYNNAQAGNYTLGDPTDYYKPGDIREHLTERSGAQTKTDMFYGICFNYAQAAYDDITRYKSHYQKLGVQRWCIAGVLDNPGEILLYDPVSRDQATMTMNGVYVKEAARRKVRAHGNSTYHAWLWVYGNNGEVYWIDPTWTDNTGYPWWGVVQDGEELQLNPLESLCQIPVNPADESFAWNNRGNANKNNSEYDQAIADYTQALERNPNNAVTWSNRGYTYDNKGMYDRAIEDFNQAIRLDPNDAIAYNNRGLAYDHKEMYDRAIEEYNQAIALDPNFAIAYINRGAAYYTDKGLYDRAIEDFNQAIALDSNFAIAYNNRGNVYTDKGMYDRAIEDFTQALRLDLNYRNAYNNRGLAYDHKEMYDRAIEDYNQAIALDPNNATVYMNRGRTYFNKGMYDHAIEDLNQALRFDPSDTHAYITRGWAYAAKGVYDRAIEDYTQAIRLDPNYTYINAVYNERGYAYNEKGDYNRAIADFETALRLVPNYTSARNNLATAYYNRAFSYYSKGDYNRAIADLETALRINPNDTNAREGIEIVRRERGY